MNTKTIFTTALTAMLLSLSGAAMGANSSAEMPMPMRGGAPSMGADMPAHSTPQHMKQDGMMRGGLMGMMGGCPMMDPLSGPNGKVMMQMHGEMMRAMGDIMMKYADKFETPPAPQ